MTTEEQPRSRRATWVPLVRLLRRQRAGLAIGMLFGLGWTAGKIAVPQLTRLAIDHSIEGDEPAGTWAAAIALVGVVTGICTALRRYFAFRESRLTETRLREQLLEHILGLHIGYHDRAQTGQLMSRASSDLTLIQSFVVMIPLTLSHLTLVAGTVVILVAADPLLALFALAPLPVVNIAARRFSNRIHPAVRAVQAEQAQLATVVEETVTGVRVVKGFGAEPVQAARLRAEADDIRAASLDAARIRAAYLPLIELLPALGVIAVLAVGGHRVIAGDLTIGELVAFNFYVALLGVPLRSIGMTIAFAQRAAAALERIGEVFAALPEVVDPPSPASAPGEGTVEFDDVTFCYSSGTPVLDRMSLRVDAGTSVAVVGATGSGKSTVARLLLRFYDPQGGTVRLGGTDIRELRVHDLRRTVAMVFEDTLLFHDTVRANIAFANPDASDDDIERAARLSGAADFIAALPEGYDTMLGERGLSLSGGQRQRIAIARALVSNPAVLVLDDATSAVDPSKEHEIRDAMATVLRGRTTIVIAHRPATIAMADRVVLLDAGRVVATGTHDELLATEPRYREVLAAAHAHADEVEVGA